MRLFKPLLFLAQAIVLGLAAAFLIILFWPELLPQRATAPVEIRQLVGSSEAPALPANAPGSYAIAVEKAAPAVVNINTAKVVTLKPHPLANDPVFRQFFGGTLDSKERKRLETSLGSGVIINEQGYILTNHHVIAGADTIQVTLRDGRNAEAKLIGSDPDTDVAVLKIDLPRLPAITLGQSDKMRIGDVVLAIGNPFGFGQTVTMGIVSATGRSQLGINTFENFIQTDAAINPGNSGGALVDAAGNLIGINTAIFSKTGSSVGIGFAIPTSLAREVMDQIVRHGRPLRGWLGFEAHALTPELREAFKLKKDLEGVIIAGMVRNGPAHKAGLQAEDVILSINGRKTRDAREVLMAIAQHKPGETIALDILRAGKAVQLNAIAGERPARPLRTE
jgi:Do/DeqQ family serine protease